MTLLINDEKKIIFDYSPKSNCTVVCKMFFKYIDLLDTALQYSGWIHDYEQQIYNKKQSIKPNTKYLKIKFIRNPYDRAISSYLHCIKNNLRKGFPEDMQNVSFFEFLKGFDRIKSCGGCSHYLPQFTDSINYDEYDEIIKVENLDDEIIRINKKYSMNLDSNFSSDHWLSDRVDCNIKEEDCSNKPWNEINQDCVNNRLQPYKSFYSKETTKLVEQIFTEDIRMYFST